MKRAQTSPQAPSPSIAILKQALLDKGMRQQELASRTGLSKDHVSRILLGKVAFPKSRDTLQAIARALDLDPLTFVEYRRQLNVLPESTRRLCAHLRDRGIAQADWIGRIPSYSEGHLQLILRGGTPFPKDPETIALFAAAAEASPFLFPEYLPLAEWKDRLTEAANEALDKADAGVFLHLLGKLERHFAQLDAGASSFDERLMQRFLARNFGQRPLAADPELDDALSYLPPISQYQPEVRALLQRVYERGETIGAVADRAGVDPVALFAIANGQMRLKEGPLKERLFASLDLPSAP